MMQLRGRSLGRPFLDQAADCIVDGRPCVLSAKGRLLGHRVLRGAIAASSSPSMAVRGGKSPRLTAYKVFFGANGYSSRVLVAKALKDGPRIGVRDNWIGSPLPAKAQGSEEVPRD